MLALQRKGDFPQKAPNIGFWKPHLLRLFGDLDRQLRTNPAIDSTNSGSTAVMLLVTKETLACASLGDSRCFLYPFSSEEDPLELSVSHLPTNQAEADRILAAGGKIHCARNKFGEHGPLRVFGPKGKTPGLMMTRSFGDGFAHSECGVISVPGRKGSH